MPRTSTASPPRCRQCGAPLIVGKRRRTCPRCHPDDATPADQLEFSLAAPAPHPAPRPFEVLPAPLVHFPAPAAPPPPVEPEDAPPAFMPIRSPWSASHYLAVGVGSLIVAGGLAWAGFQMWPRGPVERSIVQALEALPHFTERTGADNPCGALAVERDSSPALVDLNGDGALDLVVGSRSGEIRVFRNVGTRTRPRFSAAAGDACGLVPTDTANTVAFADLRGTGMPDALNAGTNGAPTFFRNRGTRQRPDFLLLAPADDPFGVPVHAPRSYDWRPTFADIDHDGAADLFIGTRDGSILFVENRGTAQKSQFHGVMRVSPFGLRGAGELVSLAFGDLDRDGDLDALTANAAGELRFFENRGTAWRPKFALASPGALGLPVVARDATVALADLDGDGDLDCLTGGADGRLRYFENLSTPVLPGEGPR